MDVAVALIRGINVTGKNTLPMESLRAMCAKVGLCEERTYIASGNVVFRGNGTVMARCAERLEAVIEKGRGFRPRVMVRTLADLRRVVSSCAFADVESLEPSRVLVMFLADSPGAAARTAGAALMTEPERLAVRGREAFLYYPSGVGTAETPMSAVEKALGVAGTCRNWNTVNTLLRMAEELEASA